MKFTLLLIPLLAAMVNGEAVNLTGENFEAEALESGKGAFVKFLAPW